MSSDSRRHCPYCMRELGKRELSNACGCVYTCTSEHCTQTDVPMIFRTHSPRTCPATMICHCGEPVVYGYDGNPDHHRGMCDTCDSVRCDAHPDACEEFLRA